MNILNKDYLTNIDDIDSQKGLIITDDATINPILDFKHYKDTITKIIKQSYPKFSIGIYGDWGIGKTTLMRSIFNQLAEEKEREENSIILVWFNAWRYEREEHFAIIPLLKTIEFAIPSEKYSSLKEAFKEAGIFGLSTSNDIFSSLVGTYLGKEAGDLLKSGITNLTEKLIPNLKKINELEKATIYFEGQRKIEGEINTLRLKNRKFRIIVFVDDLDRCSPEKVIEVFESIKIFLGMEGLIYILGLSHDKIAQLIKKKYGFEKETDGEQYIKKIIQIPITLPKWDNKDIISLIEDLIKNGIVDYKYVEIINKNIDLISKAIENSPREIKRFLNNFIVAYEIFSNTEDSRDFRPEELLVLQAIQLRWNRFYNLLINPDKHFLSQLSKYSKMHEVNRIKILQSDESEEDQVEFDMEIKNILQEFKLDTKLWIFLDKNIETLNNIKNWNIYRRATEIGIDHLKPKDIHEELLKLLKSGEIYRFNKEKKTNEDMTLNLKYSNLRGADLRGADLRGADLREAILDHAVFEDGHLENASLENASLENANLKMTFLENTNLKGANLVNSNLRDAKLNKANFNKANLDGAKIINNSFNETQFKKANLSNTIIINPENYDKIELDGYTEFHNSIIDDPYFVEHISKYTNYIPKERIDNKQQLREKLKQKNIVDWKIDAYLKFSKLPED